MGSDKDFFLAGDVVTLRLDIAHKPTMIVVLKEHNTDNNTVTLKGIKCRWFTVNGEVQEAVWNTKDLVKV